MAPRRTRADVNVRFWEEALGNVVKERWVRKLLQTGPSLYRARGLQWACATGLQRAASTPELSGAAPADYLY